MQKWEYLFITQVEGGYQQNGSFIPTTEVGDLWEYVNSLGKEGWELIAAQSSESGWDLGFKRPVEK